MAIKNRPGFEVNVDATIKSTEKRTVFYDIKPGQTVQLRFLPPSTADRKLFFESTQHFNFKNDGASRAWACLDVHGDRTEACPICELIEAAAEGKLPENVAAKILSPQGGNTPSLRWHAQVVVLADEIDRLHIVGLSKTTADKVSQILAMERDNQQVLLTDPEQGQAVRIIRNNKTGLQTRYEVIPTGLRVNLDKVFPQWADDFMVVPEAIGLKIGTREELIRSIQETYGNNVVNIVFPDFEG